MSAMEPPLPAARVRVSVGVDLVDVGRVSRLAAQPTGLSGVLTEREMSYCRSRSRPAEHMAARQSVGLGKTDGEYMINVDVDQDIPDVRQRCPSEWRVALWSLRIGRVRGH
jgi:hypothetical protein